MSIHARRPTLVNIGLGTNTEVLSMGLPLFSFKNTLQNDVSEMLIISSLVVLREYI